MSLENSCSGGCASCGSCSGNYSSGVEQRYGKQDSYMTTQNYNQTINGGYQI